MADSSNFLPSKQGKEKKITTATLNKPLFNLCFLSDMKEGTIGDMAALGVTESFQVKRQVLLSAAEAAEMILRVDDIIKAAPRYDWNVCIGHLQYEQYEQALRAIRALRIVFLRNTYLI